MIKLKYLSLKHNKFWVYRPKRMGDLKECTFDVDKNGFLMPPIRIGTINDSDDQITRTYLETKQSLIDGAVFNKEQIGYIVDAYLSSESFQEREIETRRNYEFHAKAVLAYPLKLNGKPTTLTHMKLSSLTKPFYNTLRKKRLERLQAEGFKGNATVNRETALLRKSIKWGLNNIHGLPSIKNPLDKIDMFKEKGNTRYVTHEEMFVQLKEAAKLYDYLPLLIKLTYYLGSRGVEAISIRYSDLVDDGIIVDRTKGSKGNIIAWTSELKQLVKESKALNKTHKVMMIDPYLLTNTKGDNITQSAVQSAMGRLKKHMKEIGLEETFFTLHKTKSKAQSDSKDDRIAGLSSQMKDLYNTKKHVIDTGLLLKGSPK